MKNRTITILMLLMLVLAAMPLMHSIQPALAASLTSPSLKVDDSINRVNATLGIKAGSKVTAKGVITNIGATTLNQLLTGVFFAEGTGVAVPGDFSFEFSLDCVTWFPIDPSEVKVAAPWTGYQVELVIGQAGGESLGPGSSSQMYLRMTVINDLTTVYGGPLGLLQSMCVAVFKDANGNRHLDAGEPIYTQPPMYGGVIDWDNPIRIDLAIVHTAEIDGTGKFFYDIQNAITAAVGGDTIWLYDGTYVGALYINKNLTIEPASTPVIKGSQLFATDFGDREAVIFVENAANVVLENLDIEGDSLGPGKSYGIIYENSGGTVKGCAISPNTIGDMNSAGIAAWSNSSLRVESCTVKNFGRIGIYSNNATMTIVKNKVIGQVYSADNLVSYGIEIEDYSGPSIASIEENEIYNCNNTHPAPLWSSAAIIVDTWREWADVYGLSLLPSKVSILYNTIHDNFESIELVSNDFSYAHYNNFYNNTYGVWSAPENWTTHATYYVFDARYNWWGDPTGPNHPTSWLYLGIPYGPNPGLGDLVGDYVLYKPWMTSTVTPPLVHDVAVITAPVPSTFKIEAGSTVQVDLTAMNGGTAFETFTVTLYYDGNAIGTKAITDLGPGETQLLTFNWDTTGVVPHKYYILSATASTVPGETNTADNTNFNPTPVLVGFFHTPTLKVEPAIVPDKILFVNETFKVNITMNNLSEDWHVPGAQVVLSFNTTLIQVVDVTEGTFFSGFKHATQFTVSGYFVEGSYVGLMVYLSPNENGTYPEWPRGDGVIATITFKVMINVPRGSVASCALTICNSPYFDTMLLDHEMDKIPFNIESGTCRILGTNLADTNYDGIVDIQDLARVSAAFGSYIGHPRYNAECDINKDGRIDIQDVARVSSQFGWYRIDP
jgi:hypothetical protein